MSVPLKIMRYLEIEIQKKSLYRIVEQGAMNAAPRIFGGIEMVDLQRFSLALPVGVFYVSLYIGILIYLTYINTEAAIGSKYLSLTNTEYSSICTTTPVTVTGQFEGSWDGLWETNPNFNYAKSIFVIVFMASSVGNTRYTSVMQNFAAQLHELGLKSKRRNSAWSQILYAAYSFTDNDANMRFYSSADAMDMFNNQMLTGTVTNRNGSCDSYPTTGRYISAEFDWSTTSIKATVPIALNPSYLGDTFNTTKQKKLVETCGSTMKLFPDFYDPAINAAKGGNIAFNFDINSVITVISLNIGINKAVDLVEIGAEITSVDLRLYPQNRPLKDFDKLKAYIDPHSFSPDRTPVYCYDKVAMGMTAQQIAGPDICFLGSHNAAQKLVNLYYPIFSQVANNPLKKDQFGNLKMDVCTCPADSENGYCNFQDIIWGMIFDLGNSTTPGQLDKIAIHAQSLMLADPIDGDAAVIAYFSDVLGYSANVDYQRSRSNTVIVDTPPNDQWKEVHGKSQTWGGLLKRSWDDICPWHTCSAFIFETYVSRPMYSYIGMNKYHVNMADFSNQTFTDEYYVPAPTAQIKRQMCVDTLSLTDAMTKLADTPPLTLTESYFECRLTLNSALINSIGSAAGSAGLYTSFVTTIAGIIFVLSTNIILRRMNGERLMQLTEKRDVLKRYEQLKNEALCSFLAANVDVVKSLRHAQSTAQHNRDVRIADLNKRLLDLQTGLGAGITNAVTTGFDIMKSQAANVASGAATAGNAILTEVEEDIGMIPRHTSVDLDDDASVKTVEDVLRTSATDKKKQIIDKFLLDPEDTRGFEKILNEKFQHFRYLYMMEEDLEREREHAAEAKEYKQNLQRRREQEELSDAGSDAANSDVGGGAAGGGIIDGVTYTLSYINPLSYFPGMDFSRLVSGAPRIKIGDKAGDRDVQMASYPYRDVQAMAQDSPRGTPRRGISSEGSADSYSAFSSASSISSESSSSTFVKPYISDYSAQRYSARGDGLA